MAERSFHVERTCVFEPLEKAEPEKAHRFMSAFGDDAYYITDDDIELIKKGGVLGRLGEYGLLIVYEPKR